MTGTTSNTSTSNKRYGNHIASINCDGATAPLPASTDACPVFAQGIKVGLKVVEPSQLGDALQVDKAFAAGVAVQVFQSQESGFFFGTWRHGYDFVVLHFHQNVGIANPFQLVGALGIKATVVVGGIFGGEELLLLGLHGQSDGHHQGQG